MLGYVATAQHEPRPTIERKTQQGSQLLQSVCFSLLLHLLFHFLILRRLLRSDAVRFVTSCMVFSLTLQQINSRPSYPLG